MKIQDLVEARTTSDIPDIGVDLTLFGERKLMGTYNGKNIYLRIQNNDNNAWLLDIDEVGLLYGTISNAFTGGKKTHKLFRTQRMWTAPEFRSQGLMTNILCFLFTDHRFALMSDDIISSSGRAVWLKICNTVPVTHCYAVDMKQQTFQEIDTKLMISNFNSDDNDVQYIIENNYDYDQMIGGMLPASIFKGPLLYEKYNFAGLL